MSYYLYSNFIRSGRRMSRQLLQVLSSVGTMDADSRAKSIISSSYFLLKTEPNEFSITDLMNVPYGKEPWTGIRNNQARNNLCKAKPGDICFIYHSSCGKETGVVGTATVVRGSYPDPTAFDPTSPYFDAREYDKFGPMNIRNAAVANGTDQSDLNINLNTDMNTHANAKWKCIDIEHRETWSSPVLLSTLKALIASSVESESKSLEHQRVCQLLAGMQLFKYSRLSVQEVQPDEAWALQQVQQQEQEGQGLNRLAEEQEQGKITSIAVIKRENSNKDASSSNLDITSCSTTTKTETHKAVKRRKVLR